MFRLLVITLCLVFSAPLFAQPEPTEADYARLAENLAENLATLTADLQTTYKIGIKPAMPFAYNENGEWKGLSVDLVKALAEKEGFTYQFISTDSVTALLGLVEQNTVDFSIAAISMTDEREKTVDFSHPYFQTTKGILTKESDSALWFIAQRIGAAIGILVTALYVIGFIVSRLDPNDEIDNSHKGAWFALVTFTTTGYGDFVPQNAKSKVFSAILMVSSLFLLSGFTAYVSSALTTANLTSEPTTIDDLNRTNVVVIGGTTSAQMMSDLGIRHTSVESLEKGVALVESRKAKAFVYDKPMLDYVAQTKDNGLQVSPINRDQDRYAIAFPANSELREPFNISLLAIIDSTEWKNRVAEYFGE